MLHPLKLTLLKTISIVSLQNNKKFEEKKNLKIVVVDDRRRHRPLSFPSRNGHQVIVVPIEKQSLGHSCCKLTSFPIEKRLSDLVASRYVVVHLRKFLPQIHYHR